MFSSVSYLPGWSLGWEAAKQMRWKRRFSWGKWHFLFKLIWLYNLDKTSLFNRRTVCTSMPVFGSRSSSQSDSSDVWTSWSRTEEEQEEWERGAWCAGFKEEAKRKQRQSKRKRKWGREKGESAVEGFERPQKVAAGDTHLWTRLLFYSGVLHPAPFIPSIILPFLARLSETVIPLMATGVQEIP